MKTLSTSLSALALFCLVAVAGAQQLEVNDAGGSLTVGGADPVVGSPLTPSILQGSDIEFRIGGGAGLPYAVIISFGPLAAISTSVDAPAPTGEFFDLDLASPLVVLVDGLGGGGALAGFPSGGGLLDPLGTADFDLNLTVQEVGLSFGVQGIVVDPTIPPLNLNFTAAQQWDVNDDFTFAGDDNTAVYTMQGGPVTVYGQNFTQFTVSTNGWIKFASDTTSSDLSELSADLIAGIAGGGAPAPVIAPLWEDLDMGNNPTQSVAISEPAAGVVDITWNNADFFAADLAGTFSVQIDSNIGSIVLDYSLAPGHIEQDAIIGISSGNTLPTTVSVVDLVDAGTMMVNPFVPGDMNAQTIYQDFGAPLTPEDIWGQILTFVEATPGGGDYTLF